MSTPAVVASPPEALEAGVGASGSPDAGRLFVRLRVDERRSITVGASGVELKYTDSSSIQHTTSSTGALLSHVVLRETDSNVLQVDSDGLGMCLQGTQTVAIRTVERCRSFGLVIDQRTDGLISTKQGSCGIYSQLLLGPPIGNSVALISSPEGLRGKVYLNKDGSLKANAAGLAIQLDPNSCNRMKFGANGIYIRPHRYLKVAGAVGEAAGILGQGAWDPTQNSISFTLNNDSCGLASAKISFNAPPILFEIPVGMAFEVTAVCTIVGSGGTINQRFEDKYAGFDNMGGEFPKQGALSGIQEVMYIGGLHVGATIVGTMTLSVHWRGTSANKSLIIPGAFSARGILEGP